MRVRVTAPGMACEGSVRINVRGVFLEIRRGRLDSAVRAAHLHLEIDTGSQILSRQIRGRIVRNEGDGVAIRFAEHDLLARAVVSELLKYLQFCDGRLMPSDESTDTPVWLRNSR